jgi:histidinol phosphatase-like PHP family hydrolase
LASYIDEVDQLAVYAKEMLGVSVHPGIELSTTSLAYKAAFREFIAPSCTDLDIILIEGRDDAGPINVAIAVREILHDLGQKTLPVVISHPDFGKIAGQVEALVQNNIGLELNESKLSPAHKQGLDRVLETARSEGVDTPRFTLGSDAHAAADAGRVPLVYQHARARDLLDQLIWL